MPSFHRSGLLGFLLLLAALVPSAVQASSGHAAPPDASGTPSAEASSTALALEARLQRIAAAVRAQQGQQPAEQAPLTRPGQGDKLAWVWGNGRGVGAWRNGGGWRNGGWRNGGFGNGWRNGGWGNGFRNGPGVVIRW